MWVVFNLQFIILFDKLGHVMIAKLMQRIKSAYLYHSKPFIVAYREQTDMRVRVCPATAVGGMWHELGELQFEFLKRRGLKPHHRLLDIGCGTLRGGRHFIRYLDVSNYTGLDVSPEALKHAKTVINQGGLSEKYPTLVLNVAGDLRLENIKGKFDFILAQSVFSHLPEEFIFDCFDNIHKVLSGTFYFTIVEGVKERRGHKGFAYPVSWVRQVIEDRGYEFQNWAHDYPHPRGQIMLSASKR